MRRRVLTAATAILAAWGMAACGGTDGDPTTGGGFEARDDASDQTRVVGRAVTSDDEPAAGVTVFVRSESGDRVRGETGADGRFELDGAPAGPATVVLNDGEGHGGVRRLELLADGENRVGTVELEPLTDLPELVKFPGVGFEHRVTDTRGDYHFPEYSSDRSKVYAARRIDGKENWDIVAIDTQTGNERTLAEGYNLNTIQSSYWADPEEPQRRVFRLVEDRYLMWTYDGEEKSSLRTVYDLKKDEIVFDSKEVGVQLMRKTAVMEDQTVMPMAVERENVSGQRFATAYRVKFFVLDHASGDVEEGPWALGDGEWTWFFGIDDTAQSSFVYRAEPACGNESEGFERCQRFKGAGETPFYTYASEDRSTAPLGEPSELTNARAELDASGETAYVFGSDVSGSEWTSTVRRFDVASGDSTTFTLPTKADQDDVDSPEFHVGADEEDIYVTWGKELDEQGDANLPQGRLFGHWEDGETTRFTPTVEIDGEEVEVCSSDPCHVLWDGEETFRIRAMFELDEGDWWSALIDYRDGEVVNRRAFDTLESDGGPTSRWRMHPNARSETDVAGAAGADVEVMRLRRGQGETGFYQLFVRRNSKDPTGFVQRTFLRADHRHAALTDDGSTVFYFTRDPLSGYVQLFRYDTSALPLGK